MPEEDLETPELKEQIDQRLEEHEHHAKHGGGGGGQPNWIKYLSLSTAIIAVFAAVSSLQSGANSNEAILEKSEAMLNESRAADQWAYFQAKGVKAAIAEGQAEIISDPAKTADLKAKAAKYRAEADEINKAAKELEEKVAENNKASEAMMEQHHRFAYAVTLLQIAIALSAIAALTRKKPLWFLGLAVSAGGVVMFARGFM